MVKGGVFITVRAGSTRLPAKALRLVDDEPIIGYLIERIKGATFCAPDDIILCTTTLPEDNVFDQVAERYGISVFHGNPDNIVKRHHQCASDRGYAFVVNVDGDDILCDPRYIGMIFSLFKDGAEEQVIKSEGLPFGVNSMGYKKEVLDYVIENYSQSIMETGWGKYVTDTTLFRIRTIQADAEEQMDNLRLTLDYAEDWRVFEAIIHGLLLHNRRATHLDVLRFLRENPQIPTWNAGVEEAYWKNFAIGQEKDKNT
jgi:spore coat polysaccharide biosynthesis protein SpsF